MRNITHLKELNMSQNQKYVSNDSLINNMTKILVNVSEEKGYKKGYTDGYKCGNGKQKAEFFFLRLTFFKI